MAWEKTGIAHPVSLPSPSSKYRYQSTLHSTLSLNVLAHKSSLSPSSHNSEKRALLLEANMQSPSPLPKRQPIIATPPPKRQLLVTPSASRKKRAMYNDAISRLERLVNMNIGGDRYEELMQLLLHC